MSSFWNSTGLCRCCLAEGNFKNLESICVFDGKDETFLALLRETFEMNISNMPKQNESFYSICDVCEPKLLDSVQFKRQVMECEEKFIKYYLSREDFKDAVIENDIKLEVNVTFQQLGAWKTKMSNDFKEESGIAEEYDVNHEENESTSNLDTYDHNTDEDEPLSKLKKIKLKISKKKLKDDIENNYNDTKCDVTNNDDENETKPKFQRKQYPCEQCTKSFTYKGALEIHMNLHNGKKTFLCKLCNTPFLTNKEMNFHIREQHNIDGVYLCDVCKKKFEKPWQLKKHWVLHYPDKFPCKICGRQFVYKRGLKEHLLSHSGERRFTCTVCNISFLHHQTLKQHAYTHTGERPHVCDICGRGFAQRSHLRRHIVIIHNKFKPASCKICKKEFSSKSYLAVHERLHTGEKPHSCEICNRNFSSLTTLRVHTRIHTGLKPYSCNFCSRQFSQSASFKLHLRIHTGERPYSCKVCSKPFADKSYLKQHQRIHTDDRPYCCDVCKRTFRESCQLKRHLRVHTGVKAYTCKVCNKQIGNLSKHMKVHDAERQFSCTVCNKQFSMSGNLKLHMRVHDKRDTAVLTAW